MMKLYYENIDISYLIKSVKWETNIYNSAGTLEIEMFEPDPYSVLLPTFENGSSIIFYWGEKGIFNGILLKKEVNIGNKTRKLYCEDYMRFLIKNSKFISFTDITTSAIIKKLCADYDIPVGHIEETGYLHKKLRFENVQTLLDCIYKAMVTGTLEGRDKMGVLYDDFGKITYRTFKNLHITDRFLTRAEFITNMDASASIEDVSTLFVVAQEIGVKEKVRGPTGRLKTITKKHIEYHTSQTDKVSKYGRLTKWEDVGEEYTKPQINELLNLLKENYGSEHLELKIDSLGVYCRAGNIIPVERNQGEFKRYIITTVNHTFTSNNEWKMEIELDARYNKQY